MRIVRTKSIPNVDGDRLTTDIQTMHQAFHTVAGLHEFDGPRRSMIDNGRKIKAIAAEIKRRGIPNPTPDCTFCQANPERNTS